MNSIAARNPQRDNSQEQKHIAKALDASEHEEALIAAAFIDIAAVDVAAALVDVRDFFDRVLGQIWLVMLGLRESQKGQPDFAVIRRMLVSAEIYDLFGGDLRLAKLIQSTPNAAFINFHAKQVRSASHRRRLADFARQLYSRAVDPAHETTSIASWASASMDVFSADPTERVQTIADACDVAIERVERSMASNTSMGKRCGLRGVDEVTGGLFAGELTVIAARTSVGKTAFATTVAYNVACDNVPTLMVSLEMEQWEVAIRVLASETQLSVGQFKSAALSSDEMLLAKQQIDAMRGIPFDIWRPYRVTTRQIRARAKMAKATTGLGLLVIDYVSLVSPDDRRLPRHEQLSQITKDLKSIAGELDVPVLMLCQINRDGEGKEPVLSNLRESGAIEEDANNVWLLHRATRDSEVAKLIIAKARNGGTGYVPLKYVPRLATFYDEDIQ